MWIWNVEKDDTEDVVSLDLSDGDSVMSLAFSPSDDKHIAWTTVKDHRIHAVDRTTSNTQRRSSERHESEILSIAFSPDGAQIAAGLQNKTVAVYDATTLVLTKKFTGHVALIRSVMFSPQDWRIASVDSGNSTIRIWNAPTGAFERGIQLDVKSVLQPILMAFSPDGKKLVLASSSGNIRYPAMVQMCDVEKGTISEKTEHMEFVCSLAFAPDGERIAVGFRVGTVSIFDTSLKTDTRRSFKAHSSSVDLIAFSSDSSRLVTGSNFRADTGSNSKICVWDTRVADQPSTEIQK
jgi:WD40 repeat protein